jgi:radical SAM superfamily enzyme YgiQ (UPF0313 family)
MRVLLVSANTEMINMPVLPLGMACVAKAAEDAGHEVSQINLMAKSDALNGLTNTFNLPPGYAKLLCDNIIESGLKIKWRGIIYPWKIDEELVSKMADSGCTEVSLGFESGSDAILKNMKDQVLDLNI